MKQFFWGSRRQAVEFTAGETILEALLRKKLEIDHSCGGGASCGTCRVFLQNPLPRQQILPPEQIEKEFRDERGFLENERLSCQLLAIDGLWVKASRKD
jgi:2Fe-2S ferredoxin